MRQDTRRPFVEALHRARVSAYPAGEFVGQESFMRASEIRSLAARAGIGPGVDVLDLCCGVGGPGRLITRELGCSYLGLDYSDSAVAVARELATGLDCRFEVAHVPPIPAGSFDVVLLLETLLAFADKDVLARAVAAALRPGGRFASTLEAGEPLTAAESLQMPDADTVFLLPLQEVSELLSRAGLRMVWQQDCSAAHLEIVESMVAALVADGPAISEQIGGRAMDELLAAHRLWGSWIRAGRVRKVACVATLD